MQLTITYGSTTIDLMASGYKVTDGWYPTTGVDLETKVTQKMDVLLKAANAAALTAMIRAINLAFDQARQHKTGPNGVYLNFAMLSGDNTWRARISDGMVMWDGQLDHLWRQVKGFATVVIELDPVWEGPEAQIPLANLLGTANTSGLTVLNPSLHRYANTISFLSGLNQISDSGNGLSIFPIGSVIKVFGSASNDGQYTVMSTAAGFMLTNGTLTTETAGANVGIDAGICNYVDIAGAAVDGELPAPTRIEITNSYNSASLASRIWIANNVQSDPANLVHILQAEDATGGTAVDDASASGNKTRTASWSNTSESVVLTWTLSTALLDQLKGNMQRIIAHFAAAPGATTWLRLSVYLGVTEIWSGPLVYMDPYQYIQELATLRLPPYLLDAGTLYPLTLKLSAKHAASGAHAIPVDHLQITPLDGWRLLATQVDYLDYQQRLVDDGIGKYLYTDSSSPAGKAGYYVGYGKQIYLQPGAAQRLYFLHDNMSSSAPVYRTLSVKVFYRPRRWTV